MYKKKTNKQNKTKQKTKQNIIPYHFHPPPPLPQVQKVVYDIAPPPPRDTGPIRCDNFIYEYKVMLIGNTCI